MWLFPLLTLGLVSVLSFCQGATIALLSLADYGFVATESSLVGCLFMAVGALGMWWTARSTPA